MPHPTLASAASTTAKALTLLAAFVSMSLVAGVLTAGLLIPAVGVTGAAARESVDLFDSLPEELETQPLSQQSRILAADGSTIATFYSENRTLVPLSGIAPVMRQAIISIEDSRFYDHGGVDPRGLARAFVNNASGGATQGASTLTQQYVKNVLLNRAVDEADREAQELAVEQSYGRKAREAKLAIALEKQLTKDQILERYLNISLFGDSTYGVQAAARYFFAKNAAELALPEAAMLAGLVQSPATYNPRTRPENALARRNVVLSRMLELGFVDQPTHDAAVASPLGVNLQPPTNGCVAAGSAAYFCDYVTAVMINDPVFGEDLGTRQDLLYRGGLTIQTTLDPRVQQIAQSSVDGAIPPTDPSGLAVAAVTVQPGTGNILSMAQNSVYNPNEGEPQPGQTAINYNVDEALGDGQGNQPGSNFKPVVLAAWLEAGRALNQTVGAPPDLSIPLPEFRACGRAYPRNTSRPLYEVGNAGDGGSNGTLSVLEATFRSVNTAYVNMARELDLCAIRDMATRLGVRTAVPRDDGLGGTTSEIQAVPSMVLGPNSVSGLTMASVYATFATRGIRCNPIAITSVTDADGTQMQVPSSDCQQVISPDIADGVNYALQRTLTDGTARGRGIGRPAAGKTGTTNQVSDSWFSGYTPNLSTSVWIGNPAGDVPMQDITINGAFYPNVWGGSIAAPTWQSMMGPMSDALLLPPTPFTDPTRLILDGPEVPVPPGLIGLPPAEAVAALEAAGFVASIAPSAQYSGQRAGRTASLTPPTGSLVPPGSSVVVNPSAGPAPAPPPPPIVPLPPFVPPPPGTPWQV